ncbi:unnamed protein product, partial [Mesorhabditis spiculigera]
MRRTTTTKKQSFSSSRRAAQSPRGEAGPWAADWHAKGRGAEPLAVYNDVGERCGWRMALCLLLCGLGWIPGFIYAAWVHFSGVGEQEEDAEEDVELQME